MATVEAVGIIDGIVDDLGLALVAACHLFEAALCLDPGSDLADHVDAESRRRVIEGVLLVERVIAEHRRQGLRTLLEQALLGNNEHDTSWTKVLLDAGIDEIEFVEIHRAREHVRGHVGKERHAVCLRDVVIFRAVDRVVVTEVDVGRLRINLELFLRRDVFVAAFFAGSCDRADAEVLCFFIGLFGEAAGEDVGARMFLRGVVQRNHGELLAGTALAEQDLVIIAEPHEFLDVLFGLFVYGCVLRGTMADLEDRHAAVVEVQEFRLCFLEDFERQGSRAGVKIVNAICFHGITSCSYC